MTQPPTYPQLRVLLRVIAINQSQEHEGLKLSLLALEVYEDGCKLMLLLQRAQAVPVSHEQLQHVDIDITDDRGTKYVGDLGVLHGSFGPDFWHYRVTCTFMPTLNPAPHVLRIGIPSVQVDALGWVLAHRDAQSPGETKYGPWNFSIQLPAATT